MRTDRQIAKFFSLNDEDDDVLLMDLNEEIAQNSTLAIAPGQNKKPIPWLIHPDIYELSFPKIFAGQKLNLYKLSYTRRVTSEIRRADRRSSIPERVLFMAKQKQERQVMTNINVCFAKLKVINKI